METSAKLPDEKAMRAIYTKLLESWNNNNAADFANLFSGDGNTVGFDGSQMNGRAQIEEELTQIFIDHKVASYVGIIKEIRAIAPDVFILRAVAGMIPPGKTHIMPERNAVQGMVLKKEKDGFAIALYQNTPASFDGRPELSKQLTKELQEVFDNGKIIG